MRTHTKAAADTRDLIIDCKGDLASGETITGIVSTVSSPAGELVITGVAVNSEEIREPGFRDINIGEGIQCFVGGGNPGTLYTITTTYQTSGGQTIEVSVKLKVV